MHTLPDCGRRLQGVTIRKRAPWGAAQKRRVHDLLLLRHRTAWIQEVQRLALRRRLLGSVIIEQMLLMLGFAQIA